MANRKHSIQWQLTGSLGAVVFLLMGGFAALDWIQQRHHMIGARASYMRQETRLLAAALQRQGDTAARHAFLRSYCATMQFHGRPGHLLAVKEPGGAFYAVPHEVPEEEILTRPDVRAVYATGQDTQSWLVETPNGDSLTAATAYQGPDSENGVVVYSEPISDLNELLKTMFLQRLGMLALLFVAVVLVILIFVRRKIARPLNQLLSREWAASVGDFRKGDFPAVDNEVGEVCEVFNLMIDRLEKRELDLIGAETEYSLPGLLECIDNYLARASRAAEAIEQESGPYSDEMRREVAGLLHSLRGMRGKVLQLTERMEEGG